MMFDKNNTNFTGECLCKSCKWGAPVYLGPDRYKATETYLCVLETKEYKRVGVCNEYVELKKDI